MDNDAETKGKLTIEFNVVKVFTYVIAFAAAGGIGGIGVRYVNPPAYDRWTKTDAMTLQAENVKEHNAIRLRDQKMEGRISALENTVDGMHEEQHHHNREAEHWKRKIEILWEERNRR